MNVNVSDVVQSDYLPIDLLGVGRMRDEGRRIEGGHVQLESSFDVRTVRTLL